MVAVLSASCQQIELVVSEDGQSAPFVYQLLDKVNDGYRVRSTIHQIANKNEAASLWMVTVPIISKNI